MKAETARCSSTLLFGLCCPLHDAGQGYILVTLLDGLYCPNSFSTLTPSLAHTSEVV
jgi:hypothetical protein